MVLGMSIILTYNPVTKLLYSSRIPIHISHDIFHQAQIKLYCNKAKIRHNQHFLGKKIYPVPPTPLGSYELPPTLTLTTHLTSHTGPVSFIYTIHTHSICYYKKKVQYRIV